MYTPSDQTSIPESWTAIAKVCHEANRAWCEAHGDFSQKSWEEAESWQKESAYDGIRFRIQNPTAPFDVQHTAWLREKLAAGWVYGEKKDAEKKTHPCIVPFDELPEFEKKKDVLFAMIVQALQ
jgi:hypothetical protein